MKFVRSHGRGRYLVGWRPLCVECNHFAGGVHPTGDSHFALPPAARLIASLQFQRPQHVDLPASLAAVLLTVASFVAVLLANAPLARVQPLVRDADSKPLSERVSFVTRPLPPLPSVKVEVPTERAVETDGLGRARVDAPTMAPGERRVDSAVVQPSPISPTTAAPAPSLAPAFGTPRGLRPEPFTMPRVRNPFAPATPLSRREQDSVGRELGVAVPLFARNRVPTVAENDSLMKVAARENVIPGRRASIPAGAGGGFSLPLFSAGPSSAERRRDSIGNAEYVARLKRLQERVRLRNDSNRTNVIPPE